MSEKFARIQNGASGRSVLQRIKHLKILRENSSRKRKFRTHNSQKLQMKPIEFTEFELENGLHCIVHENHIAPIVTLDVWYHVGSKNEAPNRTGFAHLFEHLMFQGSKHVGKTEHFSYVQEAGGTLNGSTNFDRTNYYETLPANQLELALWLEADRMASLNVNEENFENQRSVVIEERRQRALRQSV
jgi:zinc protease